MAPHARDGQFDGERDAFEAAADLGGGRLVAGGVQTGAGVGGAQPVREEPERVGRAVDRERPHRDEVFAPGAERPAAGDQHGQSGRGGQEVRQQVGAGGSEVFGGVEDQQEPLVAEPFAERLDGHAQAVVGESDRVRDGGEQQPVVGERGEVGPPGAVLVPVGRRARGPQREPGLADAAGADQGGHPVRGQRGVQPGQFGPPPDEAARLVGEVSHRGHRHRPRAGAGCAGGAEGPGRGLATRTGPAPAPRWGVRDRPGGPGRQSRLRRRRLPSP